ncbi:MAG TPA: bifunctional 4-hydroxy-2-oxoglutarate aldolase/2-dehydro-3-deoxy-phosphogluconate aldolase [Patescibacteria group bacterium]|nr:bifunctional 4-hydroxy-2-oxoglutarate aldolase/2-dehydro-3-deoxy-phosphogluconate aldolase [Patescibacteria group bacterium]
MIEQPTAASQPAIPPAIATGRIIAIVRGLPAARLADVAAALRDGGVRVFEITLDSPDALHAIATAAAMAPGPGTDRLLVGAGTVMTIEEAAAALDAGARFLVMPHTDAALVAWAAGRGVPVFPGAMTPSEIVLAWRAGAAGVKVFPAGTLGPGFVREVRGPLARIPMIPTGGITAENAGAFLAAGAVAVGAGGWLTGSGDPVTIRERAAALVKAVATGG